MTKQFFLKATLTTLAIGSILPGISFAQQTPPSRQERRETQRERMEQMTPEQQQQYRQQRRQERMNNMTPEQRQRWSERQAQMQQNQRQQQVASVSGDDRQKYLMTSAGISDMTVQDAIIAFVNEQSQRRQPVTEAATQLSALLADATTTPEALSAQVTKLQTASKDFRTWKEGALKELDTKIGYSKNPRLQSLLTLVGILGDESTDAGGFNAIFPKGLAGTGDIVDLLPKTEENQGGGRGGRGGD